MRWQVYGIRLIGDPEVRYIGQTQAPLEVRFHEHMSFARHSKLPTMRSERSRFWHWLAEHGREVEAFTIAYADSVEEARVTEKVMIALCSRLNHRLFNLPPGPRPKAAQAEAMTPQQQTAGETGAERGEADNRADRLNAYSLHCDPVDNS